ncbi:hypothetical protein GCM10023093_03740 [Nemorincola caseinilytica]|uniref:Beta-carotene 15,15'-monooxygenase n=1 Tax=Nemorincola caseinilytica TaxID=2054315 RepID=A0ABP8N6E8_9BACT
MNKLLSKAIVAQYYKINTGFFLVLFLLLFGLLNGKATIDMHHYLMQNITSDVRFLVGAMVIWLMYDVKCILYCHKELRNPAGSYLYTMQALSNGRQFRLWFFCHVQMMLPVLVYGGITVTVGMAHGQPLYASIFLVYQMLLCVVSAMLHRDTVNSTWKQLLPPLPIFMQGMRKRPVTFLLHYSLNMRKGTFVGLKVLSILLLQGMIAANQVEINKESVAVLMMFLISAHSLLPMYYLRFAETRLAFLRNMPVSTVSIFLTIVFTYAIIFLPEIAFLLLNSRHALSWQVMLQLYAVAMSQMLLYTSLQYVPGVSSDRYMLIVVVLFFATLLFLASFDLGPLIAVELALSVILFALFYRNYEPQDGPM